MKTNKEQRIKDLCIEKEITILQALKNMDSIHAKMLIVMEGSRFLSVLSIGDIQRAIIRDIDLSSPISVILRDNVLFSTSDESKTSIREKMMGGRIESMPVVDREGRLIDIVFWEDVLDGTSKYQSGINLGIPAVIMAGGTGSRLKPLTNVIPKPLIPVGEKTILEHIMGNLNAVGITEFHITVNYKHDMLKFYLDSLGMDSYDIAYHLEEKPLGTAGSLSLLRGTIDTTFFMSNCDILIDQDYSEIYNYHKEFKNDLTLVAAMKHLSIPYGILETREDGQLISVKEKPEFNFKVNSGLYILEPHLLDEIPDDTYYNITDLIEKLVSEDRRVGVFPISEKSWLDIGEWSEYQNTLKEVEKRFSS